MQAVTLRVYQGMECGMSPTCFVCMKHSMSPATNLRFVQSQDSRWRGGGAAEPGATAISAPTVRLGRAQQAARPPRARHARPRSAESSHAHRPHTKVDVAASVTSVEPGSSLLRAVFLQAFRSSRSHTTHAKRPNDPSHSAADAVKPCETLAFLARCDMLPPKTQNFYIMNLLLPNRPLTWIRGSPSSTRANAIREHQRALRGFGAARLLDRNIFPNIPKAWFGSAGALKACSTARRSPCRAASWQAELLARNISSSQPERPKEHFLDRNQFFVIFRPSKAKSHVGYLQDRSHFGMEGIHHQRETSELLSHAVTSWTCALSELNFSSL